MPKPVSWFEMDARGMHLFGAILQKAFDGY
jgi:hypothetical protein